MDRDKIFADAKVHLEPNETIKAYVFGLIEGKMFGQKTARNGVAIVTEKRILLYANKMGGYDLEILMLEKITSIQVSKGFAGHTVSFFANENKMSIQYVQYGNVDLFIACVKAFINKEPMPDSVPVSQDKSIQNSKLIKKVSPKTAAVVMFLALVVAVIYVLFLKVKMVSNEPDKTQEIASYIQKKVNTDGFNGCTATKIDNQLVQVDMNFPAGTNRLTVEANTRGVADLFAQVGLDSTIFYAGYSGRLKVCEYKFDKFTMTVKKTD
jgi:hypothetical protein